MVHRGGLLVLICAVSLGALVLARRQADQLTTVVGSTMGTTYTVRMPLQLSAAQQAEWELRIRDCLEDVNGRMSTYRPDSEVCRFNRYRGADWFAVSRATAEVVHASLQVAEQTDGAFDITIGPLVNLWSFGPDQRPEGIPSQEEIETVWRQTGYQNLSVRLDPPALRKEIAELEIDLSGIAKGYAVDQVGKLLERSEFPGYMVEVGGEVLTRGRKSGGQAWRIGVERPVAHQRMLQSVLELRDHHLATSGDYRNFFVWEGRIYSHEIDPLTGKPALNAPAAVSVVSPRGTMWADAYATAFMVMPVDAAWQLADQLGLEMMMVTRQQQDYSLRTTPGWADLLHDSE